MIDNLKKTFSSYSRYPFIFVWSSVIYLFIFGLFLFAAIGVLLAYFILLAVLGVDFNLQSTATLAIVGIVGLVFYVFSAGVNASLAKTYHSAMKKQKTTLAAFYTHALAKAPRAFGITLLRDILWAVFAVPGIAAYIYLFQGVEFMDLLIGGYVLFVTFIIHMLFTPALILAGVFNADIIGSLMHGVGFLRKRHIFFICLYFVFMLLWVLNFVPFIQFATILFLYPVVYSAMIDMIETSSKIDLEEEEE